MKKEEDFVMGLSIYMACLREKKRYSTAKSYQDALNSFKCFCGMEAIPYAYINRNRLLCYQSWLLDKGRSLNTVSTYMRRIRHIYNLAVEANEAPFVPNLFKDVFTGVAAYKEYNRTLSRFNRELKLLARSTGVTLPVTSYTIRHSFASFLKEQDVSIEVISELLGHKSIKTTQIYLKSFSLERLSTVNRNCFESVCKPIPKVG